MFSYNYFLPLLTPADSTPAPVEDPTPAPVKDATPAPADGKVPLVPAGHDLCHAPGPVLILLFEPSPKIHALCFSVSHNAEVFGSQYYTVKPRSLIVTHRRSSLATL